MAISVGTVFALWILLSIGVWAFQDQLLFSPEPTPLAPPPEGVQKLDLETSDGENVFAFYTPAARAECPTLMFLHSNEGRIDKEIYRLDLVTSLGFGLMLVEWRGYAGFSGKPSEEGHHKDARAGWDWLVTEGNLQPD